MAKMQEDLTAIWPEAGFLTQFVGGGQVAKVSPQETSVVPAWRDSLFLMIAAIEWDDDTPYAQQLDFQKRLTKSVDRLREITPGGGTYQSEADPNEPDWQQSFFGANYTRLRAIKDKYDPHDIITYRRCVGSEDWDEDMMCRS
ncbi:putative FAD-linked oxidoreductase [Cladobotryum mycophilum]|uniref:FAD-linked oxidoreductase n=1 Tax=Cladobotryum mycophilum TaxID=491253 RepID=A0ABR0S875_9HYPO